MYVLVEMPRDQPKHKSKRLSLSRSNKLQSRSRRGPASIGVMRDPKQQTLTQFFKKPEQQRQNKEVETPSLCSVSVPCSDVDMRGEERERALDEGEINLGINGRWR